MTSNTTPGAAKAGESEMADRYIAEYHSLDGVEGGRLKGPMARTVSGFKNGLTNHRACSGAGDHGAVIVWRDDAGGYRCAFQRFQNTIASVCLESKAAVYGWLKEWLPKMHARARSHD